MKQASRPGVAASSQLLVKVVSNPASHSSSKAQKLLSGTSSSISHYDDKTLRRGREPKVPVNLDVVDAEFLQELHAHRDVAVLDNFTNLINPPPEYVKFIKYVMGWGDDPVLDPTVLCSARHGGWYSYKCKMTGTKVFTPRITDAGPYSAWRVWQNTKSSVSRFVSLLMKLADVGFKSQDRADYLLGIDLTFPKYFSEQYANDPVEGLKVVREVFRSFVGLLKDRYLRDPKTEQLGLCYNPHISSTKNPLEPHFHLHCNMVNVVIRKDVETEGYTFKRFKPFYVKTDSFKIRELWGKALSEHGIDILTNDGLPVVYLQNIRLGNKRKILHRLKYCGRSPIVDLFNYFVDNDFNPADIRFEAFAGYLTGVDPDFHFVNKRQPMGFFTRLAKYVGKDKEIKHYCSICGSEAERSDIIGEVWMKKAFDEGLLYFEYCKSARSFRLRPPGLSEVMRERFGFPDVVKI